MPNVTLSYFKIGTALIAIAALIWLVLQFKSCGKSKPETVTVVHDTTYITKTDTVNFETLVPYKVEYVRSIVKHDTLTTIEFITNEVDSARILEQYFATKFYSVTSPVQYGSATINDTVTQNRITGRSIILTQSIPQVKETVTLTQPKRVVLLMGIQAIGNRYQLPFASGVTIDLKLRNEAIVGGGAYLTGDKPMFSAAIKFPIRLKKR